MVEEEEVQVEYEVGAAEDPEEAVERILVADQRVEQEELQEEQEAFSFSFCSILQRNCFTQSFPDC